MWDKATGICCNYTVYGIRFTALQYLYRIRRKRFHSAVALSLKHQLQLRPDINEFDEDAIDDVKCTRHFFYCR